MRALTLFMALFLANKLAWGQDVEALRAQIDSLLTAQVTLKASLLEVNNEIDSLKSILQGAEIANSGGTTLFVAEEGFIRKFRGGGEIIAHVPYRTKLVGLKREGDYWRVRYNGKAGWLGVSEVKPEEEFERERKDREAIDRGLGLFLRLHRIGVNSAGGVDVAFHLWNIGSKEIKYLTFSVTPYNAVGDKVGERISGHSTFDLKGVGPIAAGGGAQYSFDAAFYAGTTSCVELRKIVVEHMDGSRFTYVNDLQHIRHPDSGVKLSGECRR